MIDRSRLIAQLITSLALAVLLASACGIGPSTRQRSTAPAVKRGALIDRVEPDFIPAGGTTAVSVWGNFSGEQKLTATGACKLNQQAVTPSMGQLSFAVEGLASGRSQECWLTFRSRDNEVTTLILPVRNRSTDKDK